MTVIVQGKLEDTVIGFSIDNGGVPYAGALNYPLRGAKVCLNDDAIKDELELQEKRIVTSGSSGNPL